MIPCTAFRVSAGRIVECGSVGATCVERQVGDSAASVGNVDESGPSMHKLRWPESAFNRVFPANVRDQLTAG
jgi:hypothetical protein